MSYSYVESVSRRYLIAATVMCSLALPAGFVQQYLGQEASEEQVQEIEEKVQALQANLLLVAESFVATETVTNEKTLTGEGVLTVDETRSEWLTVPPGSLIQVKLTSQISSVDNEVGDSFSGLLLAPLVAQGTTIANRGVQVKGHLTEVQRSRRLQRLRKGDAVAFTLSRIGEHKVQTLPIRVAGREGFWKKMADSVSAGATIGHQVDGEDGAMVGGTTAAGGTWLVSAKRVKLEAGRQLNFLTTQAIQIAAPTDQVSAANLEMATEASESSTVQTRRASQASALLSTLETWEVPSPPDPGFKLSTVLSGLKWHFLLCGSFGFWHCWRLPKRWQQLGIRGLSPDDWEKFLVGILITAIMAFMSGRHGDEWWLGGIGATLICYCLWLLAKRLIVVHDKQAAEPASKELTGPAPVPPLEPIEPGARSRKRSISA